MTDDNWAHRSGGLRCGTCIWFVPKASRIEVKRDEVPNEMGGRSFGRCRRHAPTLSGWPAVFGTDWCGDHKLDENKL